MSPQSSEPEARDVRLAAEGDLEAYERLYRTHVRRVWSLARRLLGAARADDATQEVFLHAWRKLPTYAGKGSFAGWLLALGRNRMVNELRRPGLLLDESSEGAEPAMESPVDMAVDLDSAIQRLPEGARNVLVLRHVAGCTHEAIASLLGISVGTSKSQLHRARTLLRDAIGEDR